MLSCRQVETLDPFFVCLRNTW